MDPTRFDSLARALSRPASRRGALGAMLGTAFGRVLTGAAAKPAHHHRAGQKNPRHAGTSGVQAQASCANPGPGQNLDGCDFSGQDFSGQSLRASSLRGTLFTGATLRGTNLSDSNAKGANFHNANLCGANLSSSTLTNADFTGADLTKADLHASACKGADFTGATLCQTRTCNGKLDNSGCPSGDATVCCSDADCPSGETCQGSSCQPVGCTGNRCQDRSLCGDGCFALSRSMARPMSAPAQARVPSVPMTTRARR